MTYEDILLIPPYSLSADKRRGLLTARLKELSEWHYGRCTPYRRILDALRVDLDKVVSYYDLPFLPVSLFKEMDLLSVDHSEIFKTVTSSGTTNQAVSRIYLDRNTAANQQKTLVRIVSDFTGSSRMPMLIVDCPSTTKNRLAFSARGAGILGFSIFGVDRTYVLDDDMNLNIEAVKDFLSRHADCDILLFGFTFMVWQHFYQVLSGAGFRPDLSRAILIHGGGWKKLASEAVSPERFAAGLHEVCGIRRVHDYYGMAEQTGCIYMQCEFGHLHASIFSDVIVRRPLDFSVCDLREPGIIQVVSLIPESYPGHSLLTEDEGMVLGEDDCPCGRLGKYFKVFGRLKSAEIKGCGDTYAAGF